MVKNGSKVKYLTYLNASPATSVTFSKSALRQTEKLPMFVIEALQVWVNEVSESGLLEVRKIPGYHDEPLKGKRIGQRSVRLNRFYRLIYLELEKVIEILIIEVHKHDY